MTPPCSGRLTAGAVPRALCLVPAVGMTDGPRITPACRLALPGEPRAGACLGLKEPSPRGGLTGRCAP